MNKLIVSMGVAGALFFGAATQVAQDAGSAPVPKEVKPKPAANTKERRAEGETMLGSMRNHARVAYAKMGAAPKTLTGAVDAGGSNATESDLKGKYCKVWDKVYEVKDDPKRAALIAEDTEGGDGFVILKFEWAAGGSDFKWYSSLDALIKAHDDVTIEDKTTSSGGDDEAEDDEAEDEAEAEEADDIWALYRKEGRNWTHELMGGMTMKTTIKNVKEDSCEMETQMFMANGNAMGDAHTTKIEFTEPNGAANGGADPVKPIEKEVECKAGTYLCVSYDDGSTWMHKKYLGLIVKAQSMELIEFNENPKGDDGDEPEKPADDEGSGKPVEMDDFWERYVSSFKEGRTWTWKMAAGMTIKFEVTSVTETKAIVKSQTMMNGAAVGDPNDTEHDLVQPDAEDESGEEANWVEKEIEVEAGKFVCVSVGGDMWMMKKYPAVVVKGPGIELTEFNE